MASNWTAENIPDLTSKVAIVTGANTGIGYEMARALARKRATVILACRNKDKGEAAVRQIVQEYPEAKAELVPLDLSDLASVRHFADEFTGYYDKLDMLINCPEQTRQSPSDRSHDATVAARLWAVYLQSHCLTVPRIMGPLDPG